MTPLDEAKYNKLHNIAQLLEQPDEMETDDAAKEEALEAGTSITSAAPAPAPADFCADGAGAGAGVGAGAGAVASNTTGYTIVAGSSTTSTWPRAFELRDLLLSPACCTDSDSSDAVGNIPEAELKQPAGLV